MSLQDRDISFKDILHTIQQFPRLAPQERRVILRELVAYCGEGDLQVLQRLLCQVCQSGYDLVSALPFEVSSHLFLYLDSMDLVRCQAVCRSWRAIVQDNDSLWKAKIRYWDPSECTLIMDAMTQLELVRHQTDHQQQSQLLGNSYINDEDFAPSEMDLLLTKIENRPGFTGWRNAVLQELALKQNWKWGRCNHELAISLKMDIKPVLLAWPLLLLVDSWPRVHKISLEGLRKTCHRELPQQNGPYYQTIEVPRGHGSVSCIAWDTTAPIASSAPLLIEGKDKEENLSLPLALGGFFRTVRMCDPENGTSVPLPNVLHGFALHLCYLRDKIITITLDGHIIFFPKTPPFLPIRSCGINTKVLQVMVVDFGSRMFERKVGDDYVRWREAVCLAHEDGVVIKDEHSHTLCQIQLDVGAKLIQFQAIADNTLPYRNEILIMYEEPNKRQRLVLSAQMEQGYQEVNSRKLLTPSFSLGKGGDARDSIVMYRDRIGIMSHRNCSSDLGHYCVLRVWDLKENTIFSTEYSCSESEKENGIVSDDGLGTANDDDNDDSDGIDRNMSVRRATKIHLRGKPIRLDHSTTQKAALRILAMDHARIVLGVGKSTIKVLYLV